MVHQKFKTGESYALVPVKVDGVARIRLHEERIVAGQYRGANLYRQRAEYLDGSIETTFVSTDKIDTERMTVATTAIPLRSKDVTDFGRLETAVNLLVSQAQAYNPEKDPDGKQLQSLIGSYQGILEWQRRAREQFDRAEGQIDIAARVLRAAMGV